MFRVWQHLVEWWLSWRRNMLKKCLLLAMAMNMMHRLVSQSRVGLSTVVTVPLNCTVSRKCLRKMWLLSCRFCLSSSRLSYNGNCSLPLSGYSWTTCSHWHEDFCCCCSRFGTVCHSLWLHHRHYRFSTLCWDSSVHWFLHLTFCLRTVHVQWCSSVQKLICFKMFWLFSYCTYV